MSEDNGLPREFRETAKRMMNSAILHHQVSIYCTHQPSIRDWPNAINIGFFYVVSFELILHSIEQSFRLLFLLHLNQLLKITNHHLYEMYKAIESKCGETVCRKIVSEINQKSGAAEDSLITEKDLRELLKKYNRTYSGLRYSMANKDGTIQPTFRVKSRERLLIRYLSIALIDMNMKEMKNQEIDFLQLET